MSRRTRVPGKVDRYGLGTTPVTGFNEWISVNPLDGSWTTDDPNSVVSSVTVDGSGIRFQNNAAAFDHHMNPAEDGAAAYYKLLTNPAGAPLLWSDSGWSVDFLITSVTENDDDALIGLHLCDDPPDRTNRYWVGVNYSNINTQRKAWVGNKASMNSGNHANGRSVFAKLFNPFDRSNDDDDKEQIHAIAWVHLDANNNSYTTQYGTRGGMTDEFDEADLVYIMLCSGFDPASSGSGASDGTWKVWYRVSYSSEGFAPEYRLNGRTHLHK